MSSHVAEFEPQLRYLEGESVALKGLVQALIVDMAFKTNSPRQAAEAFLGRHALAAKQSLEKAEGDLEKAWAQATFDAVVALGKAVLQEIEAHSNPSRQH